MAALRALRLAVGFLRRTPLAAAIAAAGVVAALLAVLVLPDVDDGFEPVRLAPRATLAPASTRVPPTPPPSARFALALTPERAAPPTATPVPTMLPPAVTPPPPTATPSPPPPPPTAVAPTPTPRVIVPPLPPRTTPTPRTGSAVPQRTNSPAADADRLDAPVPTPRPTRIPTAAPTPRPPTPARVLAADRSLSRARPTAVPLPSADDRARSPRGPGGRDARGGPREQTGGRPDAPARDAGNERDEAARSGEAARDTGRDGNGNAGDRSPRDVPAERDGADRAPAGRDNSPDRGKGAGGRGDKER